MPVRKTLYGFVVLIMKKKITSLVKKPTQRQLEKLLTPKQKKFVNNLRIEGATFRLEPNGMGVKINVLSRVPNEYARYPRSRYGRRSQQDDYDYEDDFEITEYDLCVNGWD